MQIVAGTFDGKSGKITTQTSVNAYLIDVEERGTYNINIPVSHQSVLYLLNGMVAVNDEVELILDENQLIEFNQDGDGFAIIGKAKSKLLFLSGEPINEKVTSYGPYVMNTQTEIMEALRDYQMGKMGFLPR